MANMAAVPTMAHAAAPDAPNKRQDDFDMGKLQKALRHDQRRSLAANNKVAKLTPAEIRSLNHSVGLSKSGSVRSLDTHSIHRLPSTTPPLTPDTPNPTRRSQSQSRSQRRSSTELPTPPLSPDRERRGSASSTRHIHAPKPLSHAQAIHLANGNAISRPSSQSSYRGVVTYRGNEITRNNSLTMLQHPSQQIVSNPLSQFSRPRQSIIASSTSPPKSGSEHRVADDSTNPVNVNDRTRSLGGPNQGVTRDHSPIRPSDSPVSMDEAELPHKKMHRQPEGPQEVPILRITPRMNDTTKQDEQASPTAKQKSNWRRTLTGLSDPDPEIVPLRKEFRRRTLLAPKNGYCLHAIHYEDTKAGQPPQLRDSLRDELPSAKTSVFREDERREAALETQYGQHPAVRPLSHETPRSLTDDSDSSPPTSSRKGKEREVDTPGVTDSDSSSMTSSVPSYSRCSCCGRIQKPGGFESELSPVMENENLRTNFSFEVEKMSAERRRRSSSLTSDGPRRYIPIIPMEVGKETKQARIEPLRESPPKSPIKAPAPAPAPVLPLAPEAPPTVVGVAVNKLGDIIGPGSTPLAIMPRRKVDPRIVRFASLHRTKEDKAEEEANKRKSEAASELVPPPVIQRFGSLYGLRDESQRQQQRQQQQEQQPPPPPPQQNNSQSAYQSQQLRQQPRTNGYHPLRESVNAYHEVTLPQVQPDPGAIYTYSPIEKPLGDSPVSKRSTIIPASPTSNFSSDDGAEMVDLSSFDGSFIHHNISRSGTIIRDASPPTTSHGEQQHQDQSQSQSQAPSEIQPETQVPQPTEPENQKSASPLTAPILSSLPTQINNSSDSSLNSPTVHPTASNNTNTPILDTTTATTSSSHSKVTDPSPRQPPSLNTTVVRLVPSLPILSSSSSSPQLGGRGPMKLGDWVLPESPTTHSLGSRRGSLTGEQLRGVTAA